MRFYLEPFGPGDNILRRVNLYSATGEEDVLLGRNELTGLSNTTFPNFQYVSRRHVLVKHRGDRVFIHPQASQEGVVYLNGQQCNNVEVELKVNDWFSMLGVKHFYNYTLRVDTTDATSSSKHVVPEPPVVLNLLDQSVDTVGHDFNQPLSSSSGTGSSSSSQLNKLTSSQSGSLPAPALRTQSLGSHKSSSQGVNECDTSLEIIELDTSSAEITAPSTTAPTGVTTAVEPVPTVPAAPAVPAVDPAEMERSIMKGIVSKMLRQYECSICYETLACAVSLHPCGCCFCYACIADWSTETKNPSSNGEVQCPLCQAAFQLNNALANRMVDSAVREVLQNIPSELAAWETRAQEGAERRKQAEATMGARQSSSSSSLASMAARPATVSYAARAFGGNVGNFPNNRFGGGSGTSRNDVVELLDSQPDPFASAFQPPRSSAAAAPSRPANIMSFFGRPTTAGPFAAPAAPAPTAAAPAVNIISGASSSRRAPSPNRRLGDGTIAGHRYIDERPSDPAYVNYVNETNECNERRARKRGRLLVAEEAKAETAAELDFQRRVARLREDMNRAANNINSSTTGVMTTSSSTGTGTTAPAAAAPPVAAAGSNNAVFDLTAALSPARHRQQQAAEAPPARPVRASFSNSAASVLARAVATPSTQAAQAVPAPAPVAIPATTAVTTAAARAQAASTVPIVPDPSNPYGDDEYYCVMPVTDLPQGATCTNCNRSFHTLTSVVGIFPKRNGNGQKPVSKRAWLVMCTDWRCPLCIASFNKQRRSTQGKLVAYEALELIGNLSHPDKMTWHTVLRV